MSLSTTNLLTNQFIFKYSSSLFLICFFFLNNHREYIEKAIKPIAKVKYKNITKEKRKKKRDLEKKEK
jgi:hypothetical protein